MYIKRTRIDINLERKYEIVCFAEQNKTMKQKDIAQHFGVKIQTLNDILKNKLMILKRYNSESVTGNLKRMKTLKFMQTSKALLEWFTIMRTEQPSISINGEILRQKANKFAEELKEKEGDQEIDINWINRWKKRYDISSKKMSGESCDIPESAILHWKQIVAKEIMCKYQPENILNCDESGLFWRMTPDRTLSFKNEKVHGGKQSKERITVLSCVSMTGEKFPLFVIGKFENPRCFKKVLHIPVVYHANSKAWMTTDLFREFLFSLDKKMKHQNRKVALILDRCPAHPRNINNLTNVELYFLPPNTTSITQPLDAGIINSMKCLYRRNLVKLLLVSYENKIEFKLTLLDALYILKQAWNEVSHQTIINCFKHVGFEFGFSSMNTCQVEVLPDNIFDKLRKFIPISTEVKFVDFVNVDENLPIAMCLSDVEILEGFNQAETKSLESEEDIDDSEPPIVPTHKEAIQALKSLQLYLITHSGYHESYLQTIENLGEKVFSEITKTNKQQKITEYFQK